MSENKTYNFYNGSQNVEHIDTQINNYYYNGQKPELSEEEESIVDKLQPIFYGNREEASSFLVKIRNAKPTQVTALVKDLVNKRIISENSCNKPLWDVLHKNGFYKPENNNWNSQIKQ